jgi:hypothetical protein
MPGPWKAWKTKDGFPTLSTVPWKSRRKREIPTFPPPGFATMTSVLSLRTKNQRKEVGRYAASAFPVRSPYGRTDRFHAHPSIGKCFQSWNFNTRFQGRFGPMGRALGIEAAGFPRTLHCRLCS